MTHHHHHEHDHHHDGSNQLSFDEKMVKLFEHWIKHNKDHAGTYKDWAQKAKANNMMDICSLLEDVADITMSINKKFEKGLLLIKKQPGA